MTQHVWLSLLCGAVRRLRGRFDLETYRLASQYIYRWQYVQSLCISFKISLASRNYDYLSPYVVAWLGWGFRDAPNASETLHNVQGSLKTPTTVKARGSS